MNSQELQSFLEKAEDRLAGVRGSLLLFAQDRLSAVELMPCCRRLAQFRLDADGVGLAQVGRLAADAAYAIEHLSKTTRADRAEAVNGTLDLVSRLEAELLQMPLGSEAFMVDVNDLVESSFDDLIENSSQRIEKEEPPIESFEIDDETLEIFRSEAEGLLINIHSSLTALRSAPEDTNALWEIRRNAHTFKGAAGIVGFTEASSLAHRVEDLLDKMVEAGTAASGRFVEVLSAAVERLDGMTAGKDLGRDPDEKAALLADLDVLIASAGSAEPDNRYIEPPPSLEQKVVTLAPPTPVVRVSLDRLDDLLKLSRELMIGQESIAKRMVIGRSSEELTLKLISLVEAQKVLAAEMLHGLQQIRMVRFGVLEMRLNRAVHVTCLEENKKAVVIIQNPDVEVDTLVIDALIEPLLHLLKNAVVHGIERPETRRLVGKPEKGLICISVASDGREVTLSVEDDGRGVSPVKLIEKALANGIITPDAAAAMDDIEACELIFERGLTTAESLNMNAGRGVGMSIVKESIKSRGGSILVESEQQQGTRFTLRMPIVVPTVEEVEIAAETETSPLVMIIDDSPSIRRMTSKMVEEAGCRVITAIDGADALKLLRSGPQKPDLILSDVEMPIMDGWQFLESIKTDHNIRHIPVVMVTSLNSAEYKQKARGLGASDYLVKPFTLGEFDRVCANMEKVKV